MDRGRGRGRLLMQEAQPLMSVDTNMRIVGKEEMMNGGDMIAQPEQTSQKFVNEPDFDEVYDTDVDSSDTETEPESATTKPKIKKSTTARKSNKHKITPGTTGVVSELPDRYFHTNIPIRVAFVDMESRLVFITFADEESLNLQKDIACKTQSLYSSPVRRMEHYLMPDDIKENHVFVVVDSEGRYRRARVISVSRRICTVLDVDEHYIFTAPKMSFFTMGKDASELPIQMLACRIEVADSDWKKMNSFLLNDKNKIAEKALLSALEVSQLTKIKGKPIGKNSKKNLLRLQIDLFDSPRLANNFMHSLMFWSIPRVPKANEVKLGIITNLRTDGYIEVLLNGQLYNKLRERITSIQIENKFFAPRNGTNITTFFSIIKGLQSESKQFLVTSPHAKEYKDKLLQRVRVLQGDELTMAKEDCRIKLWFLETGKTIEWDFETFMKVALPMANPLDEGTIPELLDVIPPQAVTLKVNKSSPQHVYAFDNIKELLEGKACFVKTLAAEDHSAPPTFDIFTVFRGEIWNLLDIVSSVTGLPLSINANPSPHCTAESEGMHIPPLKQYENKFNSFELAQEDKLRDAIKQCFQPNQVN